MDFGGRLAGRRETLAVQGRERRVPNRSMLDTLTSLLCLFWCIYVNYIILSGNYCPQCRQFLYTDKTILVSIFDIFATITVDNVTFRLFFFL